MNGESNKNSVLGFSNAMQEEGATYLVTTLTVKR